jgi:7,8-dihydroneopterin aldolase/epimerase/oxygenase
MVKQLYSFSMNQYSVIRVIGAEIYARHGVGEAERSIGGRYSFDLEIEADIHTAAATDHVSDTVNYQEAYELARNILTGTNRRLLESLVVEITRAILEQFSHAHAVTVRLRKLSVPIDGVMKAVEVEHREERSEDRG